MVHFFNEHNRFGYSLPFSLKHKYIFLVSLCSHHVDKLRIKAGVEKNLPPANKNLFHF